MYSSNGVPLPFLFVFTPCDEPATKPRLPWLKVDEKAPESSSSKTIKRRSKIRKLPTISAPSLDRFVSFYQVDNGRHCTANATVWEPGTFRTRDAVIVSVATFFKLALRQKSGEARGHTRAQAKN